MDTPKIYVACLASYNSGILYGEWIDVNQSVDEISDQIKTMLVGSSIENAEEWAIHDYEGFGAIRLGEYEIWKQSSIILSLLWSMKNWGKR